MRRRAVGSSRLPWSHCRARAGRWQLALIVWVLRLCVCKKAGSHEKYHGSRRTRKGPVAPAACLPAVTGLHAARTVIDVRTAAAGAITFHAFPRVADGMLGAVPVQPAAAAVFVPIGAELIVHF